MLARRLCTRRNDDYNDIVSAKPPLTHIYLLNARDVFPSFILYKYNIICLIYFVCKCRYKYISFIN